MDTFHVLPLIEVKLHQEYPFQRFVRIKYPMELMMLHFVSMGRNHTIYLINNNIINKIYIKNVIIIFQKYCLIKKIIELNIT